MTVALPGGIDASGVGPQACFPLLRPQVALPELDGGLEPIIFAGRDSATGKSHSLPDRIDALCARAIEWASLSRCAPLLQFSFERFISSGLPSHNPDPTP